MMPAAPAAIRPPAGWRTWLAARRLEWRWGGWRTLLRADRTLARAWLAAARIAEHPPTIPAGTSPAARGAQPALPDLTAMTLDAAARTIQRATDTITTLKRDNAALLQQNALLQGHIAEAGATPEGLSALESASDALAHALDDAPAASPAGTLPTAPVDVPLVRSPMPNPLPGTSATPDVISAPTAAAVTVTS